MHEGGTMADPAPPVNRRSCHPLTISPQMRLVGAIKRIEFLVSGADWMWAASTRLLRQSSRISFGRKG